MKQVVMKRGENRQIDWQEVSNQKRFVQLTKNVFFITDKRREKEETESAFDNFIVANPSGPPFYS